MRIKAISGWLAVILAVSACTPAYNHSKVVERPAQYVKSLLVVIEQPSFSAPTSERDGILKVDTNSGAALERYRWGFQQAVKKNFTRILGDNGINAKLVFVPPLPTMGKNTLEILSNENGNRWPYALWIRHVRGMTRCQYGGCEAFFQTEARLFDTANSQMIWNAHDEGGEYYGQKVWSDGRMYKFLLDRLDTDGMIKLPGSGPIINVGAKQ